MSLDSILRPSAGCLFAVYPSPTCFAAATYRQRVLDAETQIQRTATTNGISNVTSNYHDWNDYATSFPTADEASLVAEGRLLLITWTPRIFGTSTIYRWADIASGVYDASIVDPFAQKVAAWGVKFFFIFHNEPDLASSDHTGTLQLPGTPYGSDTDYFNAARHVHDRFVALGATNAIWVFKPAGYTAQISRLSALYPGDSYTSWIGWDPYSTGGSGGWEDFEYVMDTKYPVYNWATVTKSGSHTMPMLMGEWAAQELATSSYPNTKAGYFDQMRATAGSGSTGLPGKYPLVKAIVYFAASGGQIATCINTSTAALTAFQNLAKDAYFTPDMSAAPPPVNQGAFRASNSKAFTNSASQTIDIPGAVQAGDSLYLFHTSTRAELRNACEGTNTVAVSTGNSNSAGSDPWDAIQTSAGSTMVYDTGTVLDGTSSVHVSTSASSTQAGRWSTSFGWPSTFRGRIVYRNAANPPAIVRMVQCQNAAGTARWGVGLDTAGKVIVRDLTAGATRATSSATPATATRHRLDIQAAWDSIAATTVVTVKLFLGSNWAGTTPDETLVSTAFTQADAPASGDFGIHFSTAQTWDYYFDQPALDATAYPGPVGTSAVLVDPTGWSAFTPQLLAAGAAELASRAYRKVAVAGEPGSTLTLNTDVNCHGSILLLAYSGTDQTTPVDVYASNTKSTDSATVTTPSVTTTVANDWIVSAVFARDNPGGTTTAWTLPGGEGQRATVFPSGTAGGKVAAAATDDGVSHTTGTYGSKTYTSDRTSYLGVGWTVAIKSSAATSSGQNLGFMSQH